MICPHGKPDSINCPTCQNRSSMPMGWVQPATGKGKPPPKMPKMVSLRVQVIEEVITWLEQRRLLTRDEIERMRKALLGPS